MAETANTFTLLEPNTKVIYPTKTERRKRFSRIRKALKHG